MKYSFEIEPLKDLSYRDADGKVLFEKGLFKISVGIQQVEIELID